MMRGLLLLMLGLFLVALWPQEARAQSCSATVTDVDFGAASTLSAAAADVTATVTISCTGIPLLSQVKMCPSIGAGTGGSSGSGRLMTSGGSTLTYQLYQDASRTQAWGSMDNAALGTVPLVAIGDGLTGSGTATLTLYGRLFGGQQAAPPGSYQSNFTIADTNFTYAVFLLGLSNSCTGLVGTSVLHPTFKVIARPPASCSATTTDLTFPATGVIRAAILGQASVRVTCTSRTAYAVSLDNGATGTGPTARRMTSAPGDGVTYGLYRNAARTLPWGSSAGGQTVGGTGTGGGQTLTVYGTVPVQPTPRPGAYTDRIVVTLTY